MSHDHEDPATWGRPGERPGAPRAQERLEQEGVLPAQPRRRMSLEGIATWVDQSIAQAERQGAFADLPGAGKPLPDVDTRTDPDWWVRGLIEREQLDLSAAMPGPMQLRREKSAFPQSLQTLADEAAVRAHLEDFNERVLADRRKPYAGAGSPPVVGRVDVEQMVAAWRELTRARPPASQAAPAAPADGSTGGRERPEDTATRPGRGRWWRRRRHPA